MYSIDWARLLSRSGTSPARSPGGQQQGAHAADDRRAASRPISAVVWFLGLTSFFTDVSSEMVSSVLPIYLVSYLHLSPVAFGAIDGLYQGFAAFARLAGGFLADRWGRHKAIAAFGYGLSAVCKLGLLAAGNAWTLLAATIALDRTGKGIRTAPRDALIAISSEPGALASAFGVHRSLDAAGAVLGPLVAFTIFWFLPGAFDVLFVISFSIAVIGVAVIGLLVRAPSGLVPGTEPALTLMAAARLVRMPAFRRLLIAGGVLSIATVSDSFIFLTLQQQIGFTTTYFPLLYVGMAGFNSVLAVPIGRLADRRGRRGVFLAGHVVLLLAYVALLVPVGGVGRLALALGLLGSYYAATDGVLAAIASGLLPDRVRGSGLALLATVTNGGRLLASLLFGALWQWSGVPRSLFFFSGALVLAIAAAYLAMQSELHPVVAPDDLTP